MGSPVSPVIANIYMEHFESIVIPTSPTLFKWWFRCVDDVHSVTRKDQVNKLQEHLNSIDPHFIFTIELPGTDDVHSVTRKDQVNKLQEHLNSIDPHFIFTIELPGTDGLPFLDSLTKPTPNSIESTVYRKPTHTDRYLDYKFNHPISKKNMWYPHPHPQS